MKNINIVPNVDKTEPAEAKKAMPKLNVQELKAARGILKEATANFNFELCKGSAAPRLSGHEFTNIYKAEIAIAAIDRLEAYGDWNYNSRIGMQLSTLSYDAQLLARGLMTNYGCEEFYVTTTHDSDYFGFTRAAVEKLAIELLSLLFKSGSINSQFYLDKVSSCNDLAGSRYRPSHRKLAFKIYHMNLIENALIEDVEANDEEDEREYSSATPVDDSDDDDDLPDEYWIVKTAENNEPAAASMSVVKLRKARKLQHTHQDATYLNVTASADTREELYDFDSFLTSLLITNRRRYSNEGYEPHDIWESSVVDEWNMSFEAQAAAESYKKIIAYAKEHGFCIYGYVNGEGWNDWQIIVERPESEMVAAS